MQSYMNELIPILRAIELIEARLHAEINVADMAVAAGYSLFHFIRTFDRIVSHTPYDYLMRRRLSEAAKDLVCSNRRVVDIAIEYDFSSHETFSRAFKRMFHMQPTQWREQGVIPRHSLMPAISRAYLEHIHQPGIKRPEVIEMERRYLAGLMAPVTGQRNEIVKLWSNLGRVLDTLPLMKKPRNYLGLTTYLDATPEEAYYLAAVEISHADSITSLLACQTLPAGKYVRFVHCGSADALPLTLDFLYHTWLPKAGLLPGDWIEVVDFGSSRLWVDTVAEIVVLLPVLREW